MSRSYHPLAPLNPSAPEEKKKDNCQEVNTLKNAGDCASWTAPCPDGRGNQNAAYRVLQPPSFIAFCSVIKKLHRLQLHTENVIHPVSKYRALHPSRPKRAAEAEARLSLRGAVCEAPSLPGLFPFFLNTGDRTLFVLRRRGGEFCAVGVTRGAAGEQPVMPSFPMVLV